MKLLSLAEIVNLFKKMSYVPLHPAFVLHILRNYWRIIFLRKKTLRYITIWATKKCQCSCKHCVSYPKMYPKEKRRELTLTEYKKIFVEAKELGAINIHFIGGEPLLCDNICQLIRTVRELNIMASLTTNGILLKCKAEEIKEAGINFINVSLDSSEKHIHNNYKVYANAFEKAIEGITYAKKIGIKTMITIVVTHQNINDGGVNNMIELAKRHKVDLLLLPIHMEINTLEARSFLLDKEDMKKFYTLASGYHVRWDGRTNYLKSGCPAGGEKITIDIYGDVFPCDFISEAFGNIYDTPLSDIYNSMANSDIYSKPNALCRHGLKL